MAGGSKKIPYSSFRVQYIINVTGRGMDELENNLEIIGKLQG